MDYLVVCTVAAFAAGLTLFSGFGLGTLLLPAFALFFDPATAVAATAVVHLFNSIVKLAAVGRRADWGVALRFGVPAVVAAMAGAGLLLALGEPEPIAAYTLLGADRTVTPVGLVIGLLVLAFAGIEASPRLAKLEFGPRAMPVGGLVSGFFGGLSGHQGALRSAFLVRAGLDKQQFIGTAAACAAMVDLTRLAVYAAGWAFFLKDDGAIGREHAPLVAAACVAALAGVLVGTRLIGKVTMRGVRVLVAVLLALAGIGMASGLIS
jgi:uncharacterized membrane protein YfcA